MIRGLIVDWGGVLTLPLHTAIGGWLRATGVDRDHFAAVLRRWAEPADGETSPVHRLERGEIAVEEFEHALAAALAAQGYAVAAEGMVRQLLADLAVYEDSMTSMVTRAHASGVRTGLLSNSWGHDYDRSQWPQMFDAVVISGEVGLRKPEPEIFALTLQRLGLDAAECVFVDDMPRNVAAAAAQGLVGIVHRTFEETAAELEALIPGAGWIRQRLH